MSMCVIMMRFFHSLADEYRRQVGEDERLYSSHQQLQKEHEDAECQ